MQSGLPPLSHAFVRGTAALDIERGNLRESLGGLRNLARLLNSLRVASKPLSGVLPDARDACERLSQAMGEILAATQSGLGQSDAASSLGAYVTPRLLELRTALDEAASRPLSVKLRLSLEERVTRLSHELDTARGLFDLLADCLTARSMRLDVLELARQSFSGPPSNGSWPRESLVATLRCSEPGIEVEVDPRIATSLVGLGVELCADPKDPSQIPQVTLSRRPEGCHIEIQRGAAVQGEDLVLQRRGVIPPTLPCVRAAASASNVSFAFDADAPRLSLTFTPAISGRLSDAAG